MELWWLLRESRLELLPLRDEWPESACPVWKPNSSAFSSAKFDKLEDFLRSSGDGVTWDLRSNKAGVTDGFCSASTHNRATGREYTLILRLNSRRLLT